jgi:hypothetical protein
VSTAEKLVRRACASVGVDRGVLFQRDRNDPRRMVAVAAVGPAADIIGQTFSSDRGLAGEAMSTGQAVTTEKYMRLPTRLVTDFPHPVHAACAVPLGEHGHTSAAISLAAAEPGHRFTAADIERLNELSKQWEIDWWAPRRHRPIWRTWPAVVLAVLALVLFTVRVLTDPRLSSKSAAPSTPPASTAGNEQRIQVAGLMSGHAATRCVALRMPGVRGPVDVEFALTGGPHRDLNIGVGEGRVPAGTGPKSCRGFVSSESLVRDIPAAQPVVISYPDWPASGVRAYLITLAAKRSQREAPSRQTAVLTVRASRSRSSR